MVLLCISFHLKDGTCNFRDCFSQSNLQDGAYSTKWAVEIIEEIYEIPVTILFLIFPLTSLVCFILIQIFNQVEICCTFKICKTYCFPCIEKTIYHFVDDDFHDTNIY